MNLLLIATLWFGTSAQAATAQADAPLAGLYLDEKSKVTIEMYRAGAGYSAKQVAAADEKKQQDNGKIIAKDMVVKGADLSGIVINTTNGKEYHATWKLSADHKNLAMKIKWGLLSYSDSWTRLERAPGTKP